jgi:hypothetical protein
MLLNIPILSVAELITPPHYLQDGENGPTAFGFTA